MKPLLLSILAAAAPNDSPPKLKAFTNTHPIIL
jgi:hypothetical protein